MWEHKLEYSRSFFIWIITPLLLLTVLHYYLVVYCLFLVYFEWYWKVFAPFCGCYVNSSTNANNTRVQKRPFSAMETNSKGEKGGSQNTAHVPQCRPWDRGDLMRRAATFKSMRWFAKPKVWLSFTYFLEGLFFKLLHLTNLKIF